MIIRVAKAADWNHFSILAATEGWRIPERELSLFQTDWADAVQVLEVDGSFSGLVTAVPHTQSGWIGNLIVPSPLRGKGYGRLLFQAALDQLLSRNLSTVWLTASDSGRPLYEKFGFRVIDRIERWVCSKNDDSDPDTKAEVAAETILRNCDRSAWGEDRTHLLNHLFSQGQLFCSDTSVALLQRGADLQIIGPWYSHINAPDENQNVLQQIIAAADSGIEITSDCLASSPLRPSLVSAGFNSTGDVALMVKGDPLLTNLHSIVSLASLGSFG